MFLRYDTDNDFNRRRFPSHITSMILMIFLRVRFTGDDTSNIAGNCIFCRKNTVPLLLPAAAGIPRLPESRHGSRQKIRKTARRASVTNPRPTFARAGRLALPGSCWWMLVVRRCHVIISFLHLYRNMQLRLPAATVEVLLYRLNIPHFSEHILIVDHGTPISMPLNKTGSVRSSS